uniref:Serpentine receptor class gamma n=1 Tax=Caenorhabditis tropicalis TaxID=1561998 RepID=A0A1I7T3Z0_9PELO
MDSHYHTCIPMLFLLVYYAKKISNRKYKADVTVYSLKRKHNLYNSYEIARGFLYSSAIYMFSQLTCFFLLWLFVAGFILDGNSRLFPQLYFIISLMFPKTKKLSSKILGMNGKEMVATPTQNDYFNQLHKSWE